jgi:putative hemolysin
VTPEIKKARNGETFRAFERLKQEVRWSCYACTLPDDPARRTLRALVPIRQQAQVICRNIAGEYGLPLRTVSSGAGLAPPASDCVKRGSTAEIAERRFQEILRELCVLRG